ncbi:MAG: hypothetical protein H3C50_09325 [Kiritimatiellae bacterium]|nr:hypothetical protein [Kiritimatiellia bacterium]MCO5067569.1 hypothetical protein [Kiritimatiellia bacterium]
MTETEAPALKRKPIFALLPVALGGILALLAFVLVLAWGQHKANALFSYPTDNALLDIALADSWSAMGSPHAAAEPIPLQIHALWRALLTLSSPFFEPRIAVFVLSLIAALLSIPAFLSLARAIFPRTHPMWWGLIAWVIISPIALDVFSGQPLALATTLALFAFAIHLKGLRPGDAPLPLRSAVLIGFASLIRIECFSLWLMLALHALALSGTRRIQTSVATVLIRTLNGVLVLAILLSPLIWWNMRVLGVPWPTAADAGLTLNSADSSTFIALMSAGAQVSLSALARSPLVGNGFIFVFIVAGILFLIIDLIRKKLDWSATTLLVPVLLPLAFLPFYPLLGGSALDLLCRTLIPLWLLLASYALAGVVRGVRWMLIRAESQWPRPLVLGTAGILVGAIPVLAGLRDQVTAWRAHGVAQTAVSSTRHALDEMLLQAGATKETPIATDVPGYFLHEGFTSILDLQGRLQPELLSWMDADSVSDPAGLREYLEHRGVTLAAFASPPIPALATVFNCPSDPTNRAPRVCGFRMSAAP